MTDRSELEVIIAGSAKDNMFADISSDVRCVKAALLYADRIRLVSPKLGYLEARMVYRSRILPQMLREKGINFEEWQVEEIAEEIRRQGVEIKIPTEDLPNFIMEAPEILAHFLRDRSAAGFDVSSIPILTRVAFDNYARNHPDEPSDPEGLRDINLLREKDILTLEDAATSRLAMAELADIDAVLESVLGEIESLLNTPARPGQMFLSNITIDELQMKLASGELAKSNMKHSARTEIATRLIASIPNFPDASLDELLDVRRRVGPYLARFRSAIVDFEEGILDEILDVGFDQAFEDLFLKEVAPVLEELKQSLQDERAYPTLLRGVPRIAAGVVALGGVFATGGSELASVAVAAAGASNAIAKEFLDRYKYSQERKRNRLFLLFDAAKHLHKK